MHESPKATQAINFRPLQQKAVYPGKSLCELLRRSAVPTLPPVQNRCLNRKECERGS
jgi:hypothetical protein